MQESTRPRIKDRLARGAAIVSKPLSLIAKLAPTGSSSPAQGQFVKKKYALPVDEKLVESDWTALGYAPPYIARRAQGWSRGNHKHEWDLLIVPISGLFQFTIKGERYVVEPGDELYYPANARLSSKNISSGTSLMLISFRQTPL